MKDKSNHQWASYGRSLDRLVGLFFFFTALGTLAMAAASVGNSLAVRALRSEVAELREAVAAMQNKPPQLQQPPQSP